MTEELYGTTHVSLWIKQHDNTVRGWCRTFAAYLSPDANAGRRRFTREDVRVLATVASLRSKGISLEAIEDVLKQGKLLDDSEMPTEPNPEVEEVRKNVDVVQIPKDKYDLELLEIEVRNEVKFLTSEKERLELQLKETADERDGLRIRVLELERDIASANATLSIVLQERRPFTFWLKIIATITIAALIIAAIALIYFISTLSLGSA
jgi:DNA-binding transcriptional MerR regulator